MEEPISQERHEKMKEMAELVVDVMTQNGLILSPEEADHFLKILKLEIIFNWRYKEERSILVALRITPEEAERIFFGEDKGDKNGR